MNNVKTFEFNGGELKYNQKLGRVQLECPMADAIMEACGFVDYHGEGMCYVAGCTSEDVAYLLADVADRVCMLQDMKK